MQSSDTNQACIDDDGLLDYQAGTRIAVDPDDSTLGNHTLHASPPLAAPPATRGTGGTFIAGGDVGQEPRLEANACGS